MFTNIALWDGDIVTYMIRCDIVILLDIVLGVLVVLQEWCVAVSAAYHESSHQRQVTPSPPPSRDTNTRDLEQYTPALLSYIYVVSVTIEA